MAVRREMGEVHAEVLVARAVREGDLVRLASAEHGAAGDVAGQEHASVGERSDVTEVVPAGSALAARPDDRAVAMEPGHEGVLPTGRGERHAGADPGGVGERPADEEVTAAVRDDGHVLRLVLRRRGTVA